VWQKPERQKFIGYGWPGAIQYPQKVLDRISVLIENKIYARQCKDYEIWLEIRTEFLNRRRR